MSPIRKNMKYNNIMNTRQQKIIGILKEKNDWIRGKELSNMLGVSDRTIRSDIALLGKSYKGIIESNLQNGYRLNQEVLAKNNIEMKEAIPQTSEERCKYIIKKLLLDKPYLNIYDLQCEIYVSESTLKNDIKRIAKIVEKFKGVEFLKDGNYISLSGSEESKRLVYKDMLADETKGNFINVNKIAQLFPNFDLIRVKDVLEKSLEQFDYKIREETFTILLIHVGVAIQRMLTCHYIDISRDNEKMKKSMEYNIAMVFFDNITSFIPIHANENELALFAGLLMGRHSSVYLENAGIKTAENLLERIISTIKEEYGIDFSMDAVFKDGIVMHLQNLLERMYNGIEITNVCLSGIKKSYPLVFEMSVLVGHIVEKYTGFLISEDEIGFLAMHIGAAYDRLNIKYFYHAVMIQPNNDAFTGICSEKIKERFGDRLLLDAVLDYYEASVIEQNRPDLILTTVPLSHKIDIPVVVISAFLNNSDEYKISSMLNEMEKKRHKRAFDSYIKCLILEKFFFLNLECEDYKEVIHVMCDEMYRGGRVEKSFEQSTLEREKMAYTSFYYGYAIPHALNYAAIKSTIGIAILKKPILWGEYEVRLVLLLAVRNDERELLKVFLEWFGNICDDTILLDNAMRTKSAKEFIDMVLQK